MEVPLSLIETGISRGTILHSTMFKHIDHGKFFVIVGVSNDYVAVFFFINSNVNKYIEGKQEQLDMQYLMRKADYSFLKYDSFLCATKISKIPCKDLARTIKDGVTSIIGQMKKEHIEELLERARESILFSVAEKKMFFVSSH